MVKFRPYSYIRTIQFSSLLRALFPTITLSVILIGGAIQILYIIADIIIPVNIPLLIRYEYNIFLVYSRLLLLSSSLRADGSILHLVLD